MLQHFVENNLKKYGFNHPAIKIRDERNNGWETKHIGDMCADVNTVAGALTAFGVGFQQRVGICSNNMYESLVVDFANYRLGAITVPMFATLSITELEFIIRDAEIEVVCAGEQLQFDRLKTILDNGNTTIKHIIVFDHSVVFAPDPRIIRFTELASISTDFPEVQVTDNDIATIMYTSGTTGEPKGVLLLHRCFSAILYSYHKRFDMIGTQDSLLSFLPMTHIFAKINVYYMLMNGGTIYLNQHPADIQNVLKEVRPTIMASVPRFWEKIYNIIEQKRSTMPIRKRLFTAWAMTVGRRRNIDYVRCGKKIPLMLRLEYALADRVYFANVRRLIGLDRGKYFPAAGAAMSPHHIEYFRSMGIPILHAYGLTETTAAVSCYADKNYVIGSVGTLMDGVQVRIDPKNDEILVKGDSVCAGYYRRPDLTSKAFSDGWFHTGDAGRFEGITLYINDRIKDLIKTSNGKYVSPQQVEMLLQNDEFIRQAIVIGDGRNFITALIVPEKDAVERYAWNHGIAYYNFDNLLANPQIYSIFMQRINVCQTDLAQFEQVKKFRFVTDDLSKDQNLTTSTLKIRRRAVCQKYSNLIDEMYS
ncbi:MAG: long-chain fatty acid--CoA ligase [Paludibacteraceae bacterium]|nr:long-chain fatty acid--CoA ligase [Paludibacteraceae bacterium]